MRAAREAMAGFGFEAAAAHYARALAEPSVDRIPSGPGCRWPSPGQCPTRRVGLAEGAVAAARRAGAPEIECAALAA